MRALRAELKAAKAELQATRAEHVKLQAELQLQRLRAHDGAEELERLRDETEALRAELAASKEALRAMSAFSAQPAENDPQQPPATTEDANVSTREPGVPDDGLTWCRGPAV